MFYKFIWRFKYHLSIICFLLFGFGLYQLANVNIYFDSERIINELEANNLDIKIVDDNNLIFLGLSFEEEVSYDDFKAVEKFDKLLRESSSVNRLFSIVNDRKIIGTGLFPIVKKRLDLDSKESFEMSLLEICENRNNFITSDAKNFMFLIEASSNLTRDENLQFIQNLYDTNINSKNLKISVAGRSPSELYFQKEVISEFITITIISSILCFILLFFITQNLKLVLLTVFSVVASIVVSLGFSQLIFGGIELVMIITPAILFIVCISDIMHLTNKQSNNEKNKFDFFNLRMNIVGKAVILTSLTTAMSFLTFLVNDILPIVRFGIITSIGVAFTLFLALLVYSISIDLNFYHTKPIAFLEKLTDSILSWLKDLRKSRIFHFITAIFILSGIYSVFNVKIDNYLTDEINKKSELYKQTSYFDKYFGGIKPITIFIEKSDITNSKYLKDVEDFIISKGFAIDFSSTKFNGMLSKSLSKLVPNSEDQHFFVCRTSDIGSLSSLSNLSELEQKFSKVNFKYSGAGYLFDLLGNDLTKRLIYGLFIAIIAIGIIFFLINNFNLNYFLIAIIPNIVPIVVCVGVLYQLGFYFSLSNAFIFTIVFGLIIDDSIHVISAYSHHRKRGVDKSEALELIVSNTGLAVIKTTFVVLICLFPLAFSEFKSVSQLSVITIISALIAIFFDLIYLPLIINKLTK